MSATSDELTDRARSDGEPGGGDSAAAADRLDIPVAVPQDGAAETARAVAEAAGDDEVGPGGVDGSPVGGLGSGSGSLPGTDDDSRPGGGDRHTFLYGKGRRVLPWKHRSDLGRAQRRRRKLVKRSAEGCLLVALSTVGWSVSQALTAPGTDTVQVRIAEWGRDHGLGTVVSTLEHWQYQLNPPKVGGTADTSQLANLGPTSEPAPKPTAGAKPGTGAAGTPMRAALVPPAVPPLAGEGVFHAVVTSPDGRPIVQVAKLRPDNTYTSVFEDVYWVSQKATKYQLFPGHEGGVASRLAIPDQLSDGQKPGLVAVFNGGFKIEESHGGYVDRGVTVAALKDGAASEVVYKDGRLAIGKWGSDLSMTPDVASVRQNLQLMVDSGQVVPYIGQASIWGRTDKGSAAVWRSGVGVTAQGDVVYVGGNFLTAPSLADLLVRAGAVRAMQLDINLRWDTFQYFPNRDGDPATSKGSSDFMTSPNRFFDHSTKDFMAVYLR